MENDAIDFMVELFNAAWSEEKVLVHCEVGEIPTFKNYKGVSLLCIVAKICDKAQDGFGKKI